MHFEDIFRLTCPTGLPLLAENIFEKPSGLGVSLGVLLLFYILLNQIRLSGNANHTGTAKHKTTDFGSGCAYVVIAGVLGILAVGFVILLTGYVRLIAHYATYRDGESLLAICVATFCVILLVRIVFRNPRPEGSQNSGGDEDEKKSAHLLSAAQACLHDNPMMATLILKDLIERFPNTQSAAVAKEILAEMDHCP
jgi:hypothetical protein